MKLRMLLSIGLALLCAASSARADDNLPGAASPAPAHSPPTPDFLFHQPRGWFSLDGSLVFPRADGDLFGFLNEHLTLTRGDFRSKAIGVDVGVALLPRLDLVAGVDGGRRAVGSEYRAFVTPTRGAIEQRTRLLESNLTIGVRYSLRNRGRRLSRFAFVPERVHPFVGGGVALGFYSLSQTGQFVDFQDLSIFDSYLHSSGIGTGPFVQGGAEFQIHGPLFLKFQGKYTWMHSPLKDDFVGFDAIDLSGFRSSTGISVVF